MSKENKILDDERVSKAMGCTTHTVTRWRLGYTKPMEATKRLAKHVFGDNVPEYLK